jgi:hypothetical protein
MERSRDSGKSVFLIQTIIFLLQTGNSVSLQISPK